MINIESQQIIQCNHRLQVIITDHRNTWNTAEMLHKLSLITLLNILINTLKNTYTYQLNLKYASVIKIFI